MLKEIEAKLRQGNKLAENQQDLVVLFEEIEKKFDFFAKKTTEILQDVRKTVHKTLDTDLVQLEEDLDIMVRHFSIVGELIVEAQSFLTAYEIINFCPKTKDVTEADRKKFTDSRNIRKINLLKQLENMENSLNKKISIGQSILRTETARFQKEVFEKK